MRASVLFQRSFNELFDTCVHERDIHLVTFLICKFVIEQEEPIVFYCQLLRLVTRLASVVNVLRLPKKESSGWPWVTIQIDIFCFLTEVSEANE